MNSFVDLGFIKISYYAILILTAMVIGYFLVWIEARKYDYKKEFIGNLLFWVIIFGIIGARLYYVAFNLEYYQANTSEIYKIWNGGLAIHGGIALGLITAVIYCKKYAVNISKTFDIMSIALIFAQAVGRWGNFFNSEAYGSEVSRKTLEAIKIIPEFVINGMNINDVYYHPTFYYESLWCIIGFILLLLVRKFYKYLKIGQLTSLYFVWYGIGRFFIEALRTDSLMYGDIKVAQAVSLLLILVGLASFIKKMFSSRFENLYIEEFADEIRF